MLVFKVRTGFLLSYIYQITLRRCRAKHKLFCYSSLIIRWPSYFNIVSFANIHVHLLFASDRSITFRSKVDSCRHLLWKLIRQSLCVIYKVSVIYKVINSYFWVINLKLKEKFWANSVRVKNMAMQPGRWEVLRGQRSRNSWPWRHQLGISPLAFQEVAILFYNKDLKLY